MLVECPKCGERGSLVEEKRNGKKYFRVDHGSNRCYLGKPPIKVRRYVLEEEPTKIE